MNNLSNLRYLELPSSLFSSIPEIGKLISLHELNNFEVKNESGYRIGELKQMNNLQKLSINSLENVEDAQEACNAKLLDKRNLTDLTIKWGSCSNSIDFDDENVLDNLQPPSCLQKLRIEEYMGVRSAIWMNTADFISNLEIIKLSNCSNWQTLPPFGQLRFLKSLHLNSMPKVERFDNKFHGNNGHCVFPSLEVLYICHLEALEDWFDPKEAAAGDMFPCLTKLYLIECPKLQELPYLPPKLNNLEICNIGWKTLNCCTISKLEELHVYGCPNITNIYLARIAALRLLKIRDFPNLNSVGGHPEVETTEKRQLIVSCLRINNPSILLMEPLRSITSLQKLDIEHNIELVSFPIEAERWFLKVSSSLRHLNFAWLHSLQSLPSSLESLSSLKKLAVEKVPQLRELPNLPSSLAKLKLENLDNLDCLPSCLPSLSSLKKLSIKNVGQLRELPNLPLSLAELSISDVPQLRELPNLPPSLAELSINRVPQLRELTNLPPSLASLRLITLDNLDCLLSCLPSLSSLIYLSIENVPQLRELPNLPPSLADLSISGVPQLRELPNLPLSLGKLSIRGVPQLRELPNLPPSLASLSIHRVPQLRELPNLPSSLAELYLENLDNLDCLPSCLPSLSSLKTLSIKRVPRLQDLTDLPSSLKYLSITKCHPDLMKRYRRDEGSDWQKIAHITHVYIY